ncbi:MAG: hypothetical protein ACI4I9_04920 [Porcipelethomonas sp.]
MTSILRKFNCPHEKSYFRNGLTANKKIFIITCILQLLGFPLMSVMAVAETVSYFDSGYLFIVISVFCVIAAIFCGIIIAMNNFSYLYKKSKVDMVFALPIKAKNRFLCDFFSGLALYTLPYIAAAVISIAIFLISGTCVDDIHEILYEENLLGFGLKGALGLLMIMIMFYTLAVLVIQCCGTVFESLMNIFLINIIIPGMIMVISAMMLYNLYGIEFEYSALNPLCYTSPVGGVVAVCLDMCRITEPTEAYVPTYGKWLVLYILVTAVYFAAAFFLHRKRKAESVSKPYAFKLLYYITITSITMAICLIARSNTEFILPVIFFAAIVYMIFEVITNRGFRKFYMSAIRFGVTMLSVLLICIAAKATRGFGSEGYVPSAGSVKSVSVNYTGYNNFINEKYIPDYPVYTSKDAIECITKVQKSAIDTYKSGKFSNYYYFDTYYEYDSDKNSTDYPRYTLELTYNMKNGSHIYRNYQLTLEEAAMLYPLDTADELAEYFRQFLMDDIKNVEYTDNNKRITKYELGIKTDYTQYSYTSINYENAVKIADAYSQDYSEMTADDILRSKTVCYISNYSIPVKESFTRTLKLLEEMHIIISTSPYSYSYYDEIRLYPPEGYSSSDYSDFTASYGNCRTTEDTARTVYPQDFNKLIKYAEKDYLDEHKCYVMIADGTRFVIPYEYSDIASEIYTGAPEAYYPEIIEQYHNITNDIMEMPDHDIIQKYSLSDTPETYAQLGVLYSLSWSCYDDYSSFDQYYTNYNDFSSNSTTDNIYYRHEKELWDLWQIFKRFFGYSSLEEYTEKTGTEESTVSDEWNIYYENFSCFCD